MPPPEDPEDYIAPAAQRVRAGTLLLANTDLLEPTFRRSVIYIVEHKSKEDATKNWAAFQADEEWKKVRAESEAGGPLTTKPPEAVYMNPTDFSRLK